MRIYVFTLRCQLLVVELQRFSTAGILLTVQLEPCWCVIFIMKELFGFIADVIVGLKTQEAVIHPTCVFAEQEACVRSNCTFPTSLGVE